MGPNGEILTSIMEKCVVSFEGKEISKEFILRNYSEFLLSTFDREKHNLGMVLHTGSICFDAIFLVHAAISDILYNTTTPEEIVKALSDGDYVIYNKSRYVYKGVELRDNQVTGVKGEMAVLISGKGNHQKTLVPKMLWHKIVPYGGKGTTTGSVGVKSRNPARNLFFNSVMGINDQNIPRMINSSTVAVMAKDRANRLAKGISISFLDGNRKQQEIKLAELLSMAYFSDANQFDPYPGDPAKTQPVIKFTGKVSVARSLAKTPNCRGILISGRDMFQRGETEIPQLFGKKKIQYIYVGMPIAADAVSRLIDMAPEAGLFACTKDFLLSHSNLNVASKNELTEELKKQVDNIIDKEITEVVIPRIIEWETLGDFRKEMRIVKRNQDRTPEKADFVIRSYSLMNLFLTAVFPLRRMEELINDGTIQKVEKPKDRLARIAGYHDVAPFDLKPSVKRISEILTSLYEMLYDKAPKAKQLFDLIKDSSANKICVVVPKSYYEPLLKMEGAVRLPWKIRDKFMTVTANRFDDSRLYDEIITVGDFTGTHFNSLKCSASSDIKVLLCSAEEPLYRKKMRDEREFAHKLNTRSTLKVDEDYEEEPPDTDLDKLRSAEEFESEIEEYFVEASLAAARSGGDGGTAKKDAEVVVAAVFDDDEIAFFTKGYSAYVLDEVSHQVNEVEASKLSDGDMVIFTRSSDKTRDIVAEILEMLIAGGKVSREVYDLSRKWKTAMIEYLRYSRLTKDELVRKLIRGGISVQEQTILGWLDRDSHVVCPQKVESIKKIAEITGNRYLEENVNQCFAAGKEIYHVRRKILEEIGRVVRAGASGNTGTSGFITVPIAEKIKDSAVILRIRTIRKINNEPMPIGKVNRPLSLD